MEWDDHAATWDDDPAVRTYAEGAFGALTRILAERGLELDGKRVLDFGCGTGLLTEALAPRAGQVVGLDPAAKMVEVLQRKVEARGWSHVHTVANTLEDAVASTNPHVAGPFDLIVCSSVCAFLPDYPGTTAQLASLLAPGGLFVQFDWELDPTDEEPYGLTRAQIEETLGKAGLSKVHVGIGFEKPIGEMTMRPLVGVGQR